MDSVVKYLHWDWHIIFGPWNGLLYGNWEVDVNYALLALGHEQAHSQAQAYELH